MSSENFTFVHIPCEGRIAEIIESKSGGLEDDKCQKYAKAFFTDGTDGKARVNSVLEHMKEQGTSEDSINPQLLASLQTMGATIEICSLSLPTKDNNFIGVSLYCDGNAVGKGAAINARATDLARCCGHSGLVVYGDAFIGRYYDNEDEEWSRVSISEGEVQSDAPWVISCAKVNAGRNMSAYSSSGVLANATKPAVNVKDAAPIPKPAETPVEQFIGKDISWSQTSDEIELKYLLPAEVTAKQIVIKMKPSKIFIEIPATLCPSAAASSQPSTSSLVESLSTIPDGAELFGSIVVDDSTWSIERNAGALSDTGEKGNVLTITLTKAASKVWSSLLKL